MRQPSKAGVSSMRMGGALRFLVPAIALLVIVAAVAQGELSGQGKRDKDSVLTVGYSSKLFFDVDIRDAKAATKMWTDMLIRKMGNKYEKSEIHILHDSSAMDKALRMREIDILVLFSQEFIEMRDRTPIVPVYAADYGKYFYHELYLLVRNDSGLSRIADLKGKRLIIETGQKGSIPMIWLETVFAKETVPLMRESAQIKEAMKASQAVLPVFFRQADACVVGRNSYETMVELNPQVGRELKVIATSPHYLTGVVCLRKDYYHAHKEMIDETLKALYSEPQGQQIMKLFRINRLVPFKQEYLKTTEVLLSEHRDLVRTARKR